MSGRRRLGVKETAGAKILPQEYVQGKSRRPVCLEQTEQGRGWSEKSKGPNHVGLTGVHKNFGFYSETKEKDLTGFEQQSEFT